MEPIKRGELVDNIKSATVVFLDTGESQNLGTRPDSVCHFCDPFQIENDIVTLRLDWSDLDQHGYPVLDADFVDKHTNKKRSLKGTRKGAHHTFSSREGGRTYTWEFKECRRPFKISVCWLASAADKARFSDTAVAVVIKKCKACGSSFKQIDDEVLCENCIA